MRSATKEPEIIYQSGKPVRVVIDIGDYIRLIEKNEDNEDIRELKKLRSQKLSFRSLNDYLAEHVTKI